jgi:hypothetical protein
MEYAFDEIVTPINQTKNIDPQSNQLQFTDKPIPNYVIGVVSGLRGPSGLSVVVSSDYLLDLLDSVAPLQLMTSLLPPRIKPDGNS